MGSTWKGLCGPLLDGCFKKKDLCNIELSAELATFLMDHHFLLKVTDQSWLSRLGHLLDVFFTMHEVSFSLQAEQLVVFVLSPEVWARRLWENGGFHGSGGPSGSMKSCLSRIWSAFRYPKHSLPISAAKWMCPVLVTNLIYNIPLFPAIVYKTRDVFAFLK